MGGDLPAMCAARVEVEFKELGVANLDQLAAAMNLTTSEPIQQRLESNRRCFGLLAAGQIAAYGWVTRGPECVGELEREFHLHDDEAYVWDCATLPAWRGQRCYSALLSQIIYRLDHERAARIWIGASLHNQPSVRGFVNAGFERVLDLSYRRIYSLRLMWLRAAPSARRSFVSAAYRILRNDHERRFGRLVIGYKR
jgi:ribosomal protein S18 acetylase RimI-like enzyme